MSLDRNISFFIPAYNCAETISDSIESIIETNFEEGDELVIVNDCSTDNTSEILSQASAKYPFIKIVHHSRNKGGATARNTAVENSSLSLLFCLDSDNILAPHSIKPLKNYLTECKADAASFQNQHYFSKSTIDIHYTWSLPAGETPISDFLNGNNTPGQHGNYLFTKESWMRAKGYADGAGALDTTTFGIRQAITGSRFVVLDGSHYFHRLQDTSYYMNDAYNKMWSVSLKMTLALMPFFDRIDENFIDYMFKNRYTWFYTLNKKPIMLVDPESKKEVYEQLQNHLMKKVYPSAGIVKRGMNKLKRLLTGK